MHVGGEWCGEVVADDAKDGGVLTTVEERAGEVTRDRLSSVPISMSSFLFEFPTTGAISFADFCTDPSRSYTVELAEATQARANLRVALKEIKRTDGEKDNLKLVKVLDDYLPHLCGIISCTASDELVLKSTPSKHNFAVV